MADYYPLISRAVAGLEKNNGENRRALYERARAALLAQLRGVTPALNESDITRERLALEESIRKVEAESARQFVEPSRQPPTPKIRPIEARPAETPITRPRARRAPATTSPATKSPARPATEIPRVARGESRRVGSGRAGFRAAPPLRQSAAAAQEGRQTAHAGCGHRLRRRPHRWRMPRQSEFDLRPAVAARAVAAIAASGDPAPSVAPALGRASPARPMPACKDFRNVVSEANELGGASARGRSRARDAHAAVPAPVQDLDRSQRSQDRPQLDRPQFDRSQHDHSEPRMFEPQAPQERMFEPPGEPHPHDDFSEPDARAFVLGSRTSGRSRPGAARPAAADRGRGRIRSGRAKMSGRADRMPT